MLVCTKRESGRLSGSFLYFEPLFGRHRTFHNVRHVQKQCCPRRVHLLSPLVDQRWLYGHNELRSDQLQANTTIVGNLVDRKPYPKPIVTSVGYH